jgi:hypothetical protein
VIETYKGHHNGQLPAHDNTNKTLPGLTSKSLADGSLDPAGPYGPYLLEMPENPFTGKNTVIATANTALADTDVTANNAGGWQYNPSTGHVFLDSDPGYDY